MSFTRKIQTNLPTGTGRQVEQEVEVVFPTEGIGHSRAIIGVLSETVDYTQFTDGGAAIGTYAMQGSLPQGAIVLATKIRVPAGFAGNVSATVQIGDGSDADRYMTGTPDVFATAANGVEVGVPSGAKLLTAENNPVITVTSSTDFTAVNAGQISVDILYIEP